ncbi:sialidase-3-like isoform X2 [Xyrauchen texanus]|uniref:sialidase-3-like isoform X2 n=1 Tax=Xyrauchen texanus TaxID=154827 RepID=UPI0022429D74|nr:sialidase-3-like isoform X2 [Xyrauchen texanus]XP_051960229.1 sialidase-3-like isoform X2 [Xyrauchen texanus]
MKGTVGNMTSKSCPEPHGTQSARTTLFKQEKNRKTYRIPALIYISDGQTFLVFAEERSTPRDSDAKLLVMRRGSPQNGSLHKKESLTYRGWDEDQVHVWIHLNLLGEL